MSVRIIGKDVGLAVTNVTRSDYEFETTVKEYIINGKVYCVRLDENNNTVIELKENKETVITK